MLLRTGPRCLPWKFITTAKGKLIKRHKWIHLYTMWLWCCVCFRYWCKLPEVQQKIQEQKRESEAATNRLRMKLYQQVRKQTNDNLATIGLISIITASTWKIETKEEMTEERKDTFSAHTNNILYLCRIQHKPVFNSILVKPVMEGGHTSLIEFWLLLFWPVSSYHQDMEPEPVSLASGRDIPIHQDNNTTVDPEHPNLLTGHLSQDTLIWPNSVQIRW